MLSFKKSSSPNYAASVASTNTSYSYDKPAQNFSSSKSFSSKAKTFLSSLGESPTAAYDKEQLAKGETMTDAQKAFAKMDYSLYATNQNQCPRS
jgi:hypothetical protein